MKTSGEWPGGVGGVAGVSGSARSFFGPRS